MNEQNFHLLPRVVRKFHVCPHVVGCELKYLSCTKAHHAQIERKLRNIRVPGLPYMDDESLFDADPSPR
jgi:hypothetical protein